MSHPCSFFPSGFSNSISIGAGPHPILTPCHQPCPPFCITSLCSPQYFISGDCERRISPNGVCPESDGRESITNFPSIFFGKSTALRLNGRKGFSRRVKSLKSFVVATPIEAPSKSPHQRI